MLAWIDMDISSYKTVIENEESEGYGSENTMGM